MATTKAKLTLNLLIDKKSNKVVFAEAGKEFVDFLFSILSFPLATVISLFSKDQTLGCLGNLYQTVEDLSATFIQPATSKVPFLQPKVQQLCATESNLFSIAGLCATPANRRFYRCSKCSATVTDTYPHACPRCRINMVTEVTFTGSDAVKSINDGGLVKGGTSYAVMDNLTVTPLSTVSSVLDLLKQFNIHQLGDVEEKVVEIGKDEGVKLLKASLQSNTVLTTVFLRA